MDADGSAVAETTGGRWPPAAIVLIAAAAATRLVNLGCAPYFFCDEALNVETALGMMRTGSMVRYFFDLPVLSVGKPIFHYWLMAASFKLFGVGVWQGRLVSALLGIGTAALVYLLARHLFGRVAGLTALALYTFSRYTLYIDRSMKVDAQAAFFAVLGIYLFVLAWESRRLPLMAAAGGALGLSLFTKPSGFFVPLALLAYVIARWIRDREHRRCLLALIPLAVGSALPLAIWIVYIAQARDLPPYNLPLEQVTRGLRTDFVYDALPSPLGHRGLKGLASGAVHLFANLLLRDEVRLAGLVGLLWAALARRAGWAPLWACVGAGLLCYSMAQWQSPRHLHVAYIVVIVCAGGVLGATYAHGRASPARRALVVLAVAAMCFKG
ncbi:MAG: ArnT family glycosyltransferase, partial [Armatimonadota bacterium]